MVWFDTLPPLSSGARPTGAFALRGAGPEIAPRWIDPDAPEAAEHLTRGEVLLWAGHLAEGTAHSDLAQKAGLSESEQAAIARLVRREDQDGHLAAHAAKRLILSAILRCPPDALAFRTEEHGKPALAGTPHSAQSAPLALHFNLSHTGRYAAVAVARSAVGIDLERPRSFSDLDAVAARVLAPEPLAKLRRTSGTEQIALFTRFWTLGEAYIKATGMGLHQDLQRFAFTGEGPPELLYCAPEFGAPADWAFGLF